MGATLACSLLSPRQCDDEASMTTKFEDMTSAQKKNRRKQQAKTALVSYMHVGFQTLSERVALTRPLFCLSRELVCARIGRFKTDLVVHLLFPGLLGGPCTAAMPRCGRGKKLCQQELDEENSSTVAPASTGRT